MIAGMDRYRFYRHRAHPRFRLVLRIGDPFPVETTADAWELTRERDEDDVNADALGEIRDRGYSLFQLGATFDQIPD